ncbi:hypothetical protein EST62_05855 [Chlorobaculum sp. 24CR]|nr:hypothetical protein EST62_05855 [Chlorobaculum sp. 24CR]
MKRLIVLPTLKINRRLLGVRGGRATIWQLLPGRMRRRLECLRLRLSLLAGEAYIVRSRKRLALCDEPSNR